MTTRDADTTVSEKSQHPALTKMLTYFEFAHLPPHLQLVSEPFNTLAHILADQLPDGPEKTVALRKLLESKDCAVRAAL